MPAVDGALRRGGIAADDEGDDGESHGSPEREDAAVGENGVASEQRLLRCARRFRPGRYESVSPEPTLTSPQDLAA